MSPVHAHMSVHVHVSVHVCVCECECVCLCTSRGRLQTVPTLHSSGSSDGWSHPSQTPELSMTPPPTMQPLCWGRITLRSRRGWGSPPGRSPPLLPRGSALCVPRLVAPHTQWPHPLCRMAGRNVCSMQSAWHGHCPLRGPGTVPLAGPGSTCVPFLASRHPGEARGKDLKVRLDQGAGQLSVRQRLSW